MKKESLVGCKIGSLYITSQIDNKVYCYCSNCRNNNVELSYTKAKYYTNHNKNITCGCSIKDESSESKERLIGAKYNKLTVVKQQDTKIVECRCNCGKLVKTKISDLENNHICMCDECKIDYDRNNECNNYLLKFRYYKELYYIWTSFKNLYNSPTEDFENKILKNNIKFFPELDNKEDSFDLFYKWAMWGCEQKYGEDGKVALTRIDYFEDYSIDNCTWIHQDSDKDSFVKLGIYNTNNKKFNCYNDDIEVSEKITYCCNNCLYEPKIDKKKANEENEKNYERFTHIYTEFILNDDVKHKKTKGYYPYIYEDKFYHKECLLYHLRNNLDDETEVQEVYQSILKEHNKDNRKKGKLTADEMKNAKADRKARDKLIQYLLGKYNVKQIHKLIMVEIDNLNNGTSYNYNNVNVPYNKLLDMFWYYEDWLQELYIKNRQTRIMSRMDLLRYDLACILSMLNQYDSRDIAIYSKTNSQQDERGEILDVKKYRQNLLNRDDKEDNNLYNEAIKRANEFANEYTKEYEEDKYEFMKDLFDDLI